nr:CoA pyrophosphatase [Gammaproteobacteria bacterium]
MAKYRAPDLSRLPSLSTFLRQALAGPLPRAAGHLCMAPHPRSGWQPDILPKNCRDAAALLLLYPKNGEAHTLLTVRTNHLPTHQGQVSLPGGGVRAGEKLIDAALREGQEEVGIDPEQVEVIGKLSALHIPISRFILHPVVAVARERPPIHLQEGEVARVLEVSLRALGEPDRVRVETWVYKGDVYRVPFFQVENSKVWGATAMVLAEFLCLLETPPSPGPEWPSPAVHTR